VVSPQLVIAYCIVVACTFIFNTHIAYDLHDATRLFFRFSFKKCSLKRGLCFFTNSTVDLITEVIISAIIQGFMLECESAISIFIVYFSPHNGMSEAIIIILKKIKNINFTVQYALQ
jgi:hypothetical protein